MILTGNHSGFILCYMLVFMQRSLHINSIKLSSLLEIMDLNGIRFYI